MTVSAEQQVRDMLERLDIEDAQTYSAGDLVELANAVSHAHAWEIIAGSASFPEIKAYAQDRKIPWAAAVVELANLGLTRTR